MKRYLFKRIFWWLCYSAIVFVCMSALFKQISVRRKIRETWSEVNPISFARADGKQLIVQDEDLFLFCMKEGVIRPARDTDCLYDFMGPLLNDFYVGTNRIFILADKRCPEARLDKIARDIVAVCSNRIYIVGASLTEDETTKVCLEWHPTASWNSGAGQSLDCSAVDSLFYISPFVCNPLLVRIGDMMGIKHKLQKPWRSYSVTLFDVQD